MELFMIRHVADGATMMVWLPNELMFEICRSLFRLYFVETEPISRSDKKRYRKKRYSDDEYLSDEYDWDYSEAKVHYYGDNDDDEEGDDDSE